MENIAKDVQKPMESTFLKDIKENKLDWVYDSGKINVFAKIHWLFYLVPNYEKNLLVYEKFKYEKKSEHGSKLMKLGASIAREMSGKKITDFDIIFPKKFANSNKFKFYKVYFSLKKQKGDIAQFLNGLALANYKFDLKTYKKEESEETEEENNGKDKKKGFQPIENINVVKEDFDLSGNLKQ